MNGQLNQFLTKAKVSLNHAFAHAKDTIFSMTGTSSATVQQISDYVIKHPDTKIESKHLVGIDLTFYVLNDGQMSYYLETKGTKILQLDVHSNQHPVITYRSYRDQLSLNTPVRFPELNTAP